MKMRKLVAMLLAVLMLCSVIPFSAAAEGETYAKITSAAEFTSGNYVMMVDTGYAPGVLDGTWVSAVQPTVSGDVVTNANGGVWTLTVDGDTVTMKDTNGVIIAPKGGNANGIISGDYAWTWTFADGKFTFCGNGDDTVTLASNASEQYGNKFRGYKNTTVTNEQYAETYPCKFTLYKLDGDAPSTPDTPVEPEPDVPAEPDVENLTIADAIALGQTFAHNTFSENKYYVTGVITEVYNTQYGNMKLTDDAGNILTIYGTYSADGSTRYDALEVKPVAGDTVTIYGIVGQYNGTSQIKNGWIVEHTAVGGGETPDVPVDPEPDTPAVSLVTNPVAGVAYKFGLNQTQKGAIYYFTGVMSGYYGATDTDIAKAVDMYVEIVDGGYKLYFNDASGAKKYIKLEQSGTHYNFTFGAEGSVFTLDAEKNAFCAPCGDQICYMGTYGSYVTVGCLTSAKIADTDYIARLYAVGGESTECTHEYEFECSKTCQLCGEGAREAACVNDSALCQDGLCIYCDNDVNGLGHAYDDASDADCNYCGEKREIGGGTVVGGGSADFNTIVLPDGKPNGDSSYSSSYTTANGWVTAYSAIQCGGASVSNPQFPIIGADNTSKAVCMNGKVSAPGTITSPTLTGGIAQLTLTYTKMFTDTKLSVTITITDLSTGAVYTHTVARDVDKDADKYVVWTDEWVLDTPITGDFTIELVNDCPSANTGNKDRFTVLGIEWATSAEGGDTPVDPPVSGDPEADTELSISDAIALGASKEHNVYTEGKYYVSGVITEVYNTQYGNMKITDEAGNILTIYGSYSADGSARYDALEVKPVAGDTVKIYGIIGQYNGTPQIKNGWIVEHTPGDTPVDPPVSDDPAADTLLSIADAIALGLSKEHNVFTEGKYYVSGVITEVYNTQYGNMRIKDADGNILTIYGSYSADGSTRYDALEVKPVAGDTVKIYGIIGQYSGTAQVKNGWIVEHTAVGGDTPVDPDPDVPVEGGVTITFDDVSKRTEQDTEHQVWVENGITITNEKAASITNVADYSKPARFYQNSSLNIAYPGMTKIVFYTNSYKTSYATALQNSITEGTVTVDGLVVTVTFDAPVDSLFIADLTAQVRMDSITVFAEEPEVPVENTDIVVSTTEGSAGDTVTITVTLPENPGIVSAKVKVLYDTTVLKLVGYEAGAFAAGGYSWGQLDKNFFIINWCDGTGADSTEELLATLTFEILEGAAEGFTAITLEFSCENDMFNAANETVMFDGVNGGVQIVAPAAPAYLPGDVSGDGKVNNRDLGMLQQYLSDMDVKITNMNACDVTGDGRVNNRDLGILQQYLSDMDVELKFGAIAE